MCLRRLKDHGFVEVIPVAEYVTPTVLRRHEFNLLTKAGVEELAAELSSRGSAYVPSYNPNLRKTAPLTYDHSILINNTLANLIGAFRQAGGVVVRCLNDRQLASMIRTDSGQTHLGDIEPDALLIVRFPDGLRSYLIEADTGTEQVRGRAINNFEGKIPRYGRYFSKRFAADPLFQGLSQPQVLVITSGLVRATNLKEATFDAGGRRAYWFTAKEFIEPPKYLATGEVWLVPTLEGYQRLLPDSLTRSSEAIS